MKVTEYRWTTEMERRIVAEMKLEYLEKDLKILMDEKSYLKDDVQTIYDKYFKKSLVEKIENVMLEEVVDVQNEKSESDSD